MERRADRQQELAPATDDGPLRESSLEGTQLLQLVLRAVVIAFGRPDLVDVRVIQAKLVAEELSGGRHGVTFQEEIDRIRLERSRSGNADTGNN